LLEKKPAYKKIAIRVQRSTLRKHCIGSGFTSKFVIVFPGGTFRKNQRISAHSIYGYAILPRNCPRREIQARIPAQRKWAVPFAAAFWNPAKVQTG
jgi:hypothetical protein